MATVATDPALAPIPSDDLWDELMRRERLLSAGICPFCGLELSAHRCALAGREGEYHRLGDGNPMARYLCRSE